MNTCISKTAILFAIGTFLFLFFRYILLLYFDYSDFKNQLLTHILSVFPFFSLFSAAGFHKDFYKAFFNNKKGIRDKLILYQTKQTIYFLFLCILYLSILLINYSLSVSLLILFLLVNDRLLDESIRFKFYKKKFYNWFSLSIAKTLAPCLLVFLYYKFDTYYSYLIIILTLLVHILKLKLSFKFHDLLKITFCKDDFYRIYLFLFNSVRRYGDKILATLFLNDSMFVKYCIIHQVSNSCCILLDKVPSISERFNYINLTMSKISHGRLLLFIITSIITALFSIWYINNYYLNLLLFSIFISSVIWINAILDRELEYLWWRNSFLKFFKIINLFYFIFVLITILLIGIIIKFPYIIILYLIPFLYFDKELKKF